MAGSRRGPSELLYERTQAAAKRPRYPPFQGARVDCSGNSGVPADSTNRFDVE